MKNHKQWKHEKEFDTKTLFEDIRKDEKTLKENSESSVGKRKIRNAFASNRPQIRFLKILGSTFLPKKKMYLETGGVRQKRQRFMSPVL